MNPPAPGYHFRRGRGGPRRGGLPRGGYQRTFPTSGPAHFSDQTLPSAVFVKDRIGERRRSPPHALRNPSPPPSSGRRYERITAPDFSPRRKDSSPPPPPPPQSARAARHEWEFPRGRERNRRSPDSPSRRSFSPPQPSSIAVVPRRDRSRSPRFHGSPPRHARVSPLRSQVGHHEPPRRGEFQHRVGSPPRPSPPPQSLRGKSPGHARPSLPYRGKPLDSHLSQRGQPPPRRHSPPRNLSRERESSHPSQRGHPLPRRHSPPRNLSRERESSHPSQRSQLPQPRRHSPPHNSFNRERESTRDTRPFQRPGPSPRQGEQRRRDEDSRHQDPSLEEVMIAEKVIAHGMETARPAWLGVPCLLEPTFLVISDGPLSRLVFDHNEENKRFLNRDSVDLTRDKPKGASVHLYNDSELMALSGLDRFFRRLGLMVGSAVPAHVYVIIGRNDARAEPGMSTSSLREKIVRTFFDRVRSEYAGTDITWAGVGGLPLTSPQCQAVQSLARSMDGFDATTGNNERRPWLKCVDMCGSSMEEDLLRGGDSWTRQFAHVFGTNLCHRMSKDLKEFRMKRVRHLFNLPGPKCGVGVGNVTITDHH